MGRVRFSDVVKRVNVFVDREHTDLLYYVGGEHIDSDAFMVRKNGLIKGATIGYKFHFGFQPGHILFMSRNPHLRKCSMVDFAGVCSDSTYVVETRDENVLLQKYLLIEMQSDRFWKWAEENKSGSVNYLINYCTLDSYEFDLPPIEEQRALAEKLWAANDLKEKYQHLLAATDEMLKAKLREMFGEFGGQSAECGGADRRGCGLVAFKDCYAKMLGGKTPSMSRPEFYGGKVPFIKSGDVRGDYLSNGALWLSDTALKEGGAKYVPAGAVIVVVRSATLKNELRVAIAKNELVINQDLKAFVPRDEFDSQFLMHAIRLRTFELLSKVQTMVTSHLELSDLNQILIPKVPICVQREFVAIANAAEASKAELKKSITSIDAVMKELING
jgi:type I restriction enzyme S subunit